MLKYSAKPAEYCSSCGRHSAYTLGETGLCTECFRKLNGDANTLSMMEQQLLQKEDDIANLQTIINIMQEMKTKIVEHKEAISTQ